MSYKRAWLLLDSINQAFTEPVVTAATGGSGGGGATLTAFGIEVLDIKLVVSLPTMLVGFALYSRDRSFVVLAENRGFVLVVAAGSILGAFIGGQLLGVIPNIVLLPLLAVILALSAVKVWTHK